MKRTNLVLDESLLKEAVSVLKTRTYSEAVNTALEQAIKLARMRGMLELEGAGVWEGDLKAMRADRTKTAGRRTSR